MRYSNLELAVTFSAEHAGLQPVNKYTYLNDIEDDEWITAANGLKFFFDEVDENQPDLRIGYIKVPESHQLYNWVLLLHNLYRIFDILPLTNTIKSLYVYGIRHIHKAGIPITLQNTFQYDNIDD